MFANVCRDGVYDFITSEFPSKRRDSFILSGVFLLTYVHEGTIFIRQPTTKFTTQQRAKYQETNCLGRCRGKRESHDLSTDNIGTLTSYKS